VRNVDGFTARPLWPTRAHALRVRTWTLRMLARISHRYAQKQAEQSAEGVLLQAVGVAGRL
jgi:hypothetical protein